MSETRQTPSTTVPRQGQAAAAREPTGWAGWAIFAGIMMYMIGVFQIIAGLAALFKTTYFAIPEADLLVATNYDAWGWTHLGIGVVVVLAGLGVMTGQTWARVVAIGMASVQAIVMLGFIGAFPLWSLIVVGLDVVVIYALAVHGGELKYYQST